MKKTLLACVVTSMALIGCGGGGGSSKGSAPSNPQTPPVGNLTPVQKLTDAANLDREGNSTWYQFDVNEDNANYFTHHNYHNPTEFIFKDGKIFSLVTVPPQVYPTYFTKTASYLYSGSDDIDNLGNAQRIGKIKNKQVVTEKDANGQDVVYLAITSVPYTANQYDDKELTITHKYKVINLNGKPIGETLSPFYSAYVNSPVFRENALENNAISKLVKMTDKNGSFASPKFTDGAYCLSLVSSTANQDYFFAKQQSSLPSPTFESIKDIYSVKQDFNVKGGSTGTLFTLPDENFNLADTPDSAIVLEDNNSNMMTARYHIGQFFKQGEHNYQATLDNFIGRVITSYLEDDYEAEGKLPVGLEEELRITQQTAVSGCHLYNREGRNQARMFLIDVNK